MKINRFISEAIVFDWHRFDLLQLFSTEKNTFWRNRGILVHISFVDFNKLIG